VIVQGTSVGLDVYALSVVAHAVDEETGKVARARLCPDHGEVLGWLHQLRAPVRVAYEAGPTGFGLARAITEAGMECVVAAPSKLQRPAGDRSLLGPSRRGTVPAHRSGYRLACGGILRLGRSGMGGAGIVAVLVKSVD
jgi:hypothetical protein